MSVPLRDPEGACGYQNMERELHVCVEGIQLRFCFDFFFPIQLPAELCLCGSVSVSLRDPEGVCDCQNMEPELHVCVEGSQLRFCFDFSLI